MHERPIDRFAQERTHLLSTSHQPSFRLEARLTRTVAEGSLVSVHTNRYSVAFTLIGQSVEVLRRAGQLLIFHRGVLMAEHTELQGRHQLRILPEHGPGPVRGPRAVSTRHDQCGPPRGRMLPDVESVRT